MKPDAALTLQPPRPPQPSDDGLPNGLPRPPHELPALERAWAPPRGWRRIGAVNNTQVGVMYVAAALLFFVLAGVLGLLIRLQLAWPGMTLLGPQAYNQVFTMHGTVMMFLFAVPVVEAIAVYLLPGMLGARDLPFPRLSAYAFWAYAIGGLAFFGTLFFGAAPDGGWFMYPPLTSGEHSPGRGADWWLLGIGFIEISAIAGAIELVVGILFMRAPGMTLQRMPVFAWAMLVVALMIVFAFPAIIAGTLLLELERALDWPFFIPARGGDPLLWQHLFWFFGHPEVYIIFLPAAGLVSMMVATLARTPLVGYRAVVWALAAIGVLSFALWAHHMFTAGLSRDAMLWVSAASLAIALPSGVQVFAWLATIRRGRSASGSLLAGHGLYLLAFLLLFVLGGLTGVMVAVLPFDWQVHDSHFVVAHLHYVLIGGMVFPVFAALAHWGPLLNGHTMRPRVLRWSCAAMFVGFNLAFFPMHVSGLLGMPRRVYTYDAGLGWTAWNLASTIGAFVFAAGIALFAWEAWRTWRRPKRAHGNPWHAGTLEWLPAEDYGVRSVPQVPSREPLWSRPALADEVPAGRHWLPGSATGGRETLVTGWRDARPRYVLQVSGDSLWPFVAAVGTAGFFLLLTVHWSVPAFACGVLAIGAALRWVWDTDRHAAGAMVRVADGSHVPDVPSGLLPLGPPRAAPHVWAAMLTLLLVDATIFGSLGFTHLHLAMAGQTCPPPGARLPDADWAGAAAGGWALAALLIVLAWRRPLDTAVRRTLRGPSLLLLAACGAAALAVGFDLHGHAQSGLSPRASGWSASVAALIAWQALHAAVLVIFSGYLLARWWHGQAAPGPRATRDACLLLWLYTALQGMAAIVLVQALPRLLG